VTYPDGSVLTVRLAGDGRFGDKVPVVERAVLETGGEAGPRLASTIAVEEGWCNFPHAEAARIA
jgi:hypothetical protein